MLSQEANSPADPNRHPRSRSSNKGGRHRHIHRAKGYGQAPGPENRPKTRTHPQPFPSPALIPSSPPEDATGPNKKEPAGSERCNEQDQQSAQSPMPGTGLQPQPGKQRNNTHPTPTQRLPISHTWPKMAGPPKCKLQASIGTCTPHRQTNQNHQGHPGSQADPTMHHPTHHRSQGKNAGPAGQRVPKKDHSTHML
ncbi:hypothetical protein CRENBAI_013500 [Crenichthys baileyi]|uniref:Uncharacterized protein n=1 Tax=Crenichthys baileyi TaxID=28760 RepID=A0AAV9SBM2_9TELE